MKSELCSLATPFLHYFLSQSQRPGDEQGTRERTEWKKKRRCKGRRPAEGRTPQRRMTENEIKELKEDNEKRKVEVKMCEDCGLLWLLCALNPIPYLTEHVQSAGLQLVSDLRQVSGIRHIVCLNIVSDLGVETYGIDLAVFFMILRKPLLFCICSAFK